MYIILASVFFSFYFVVIAQIHKAIRKGFNIPYTKRLKPFDCISCLPVWVALVLYFLPIEVSQAIVVIFGSGILGFAIGIMLDKLGYIK